MTSLLVGEEEKAKWVVQQRGSRGKTKRKAFPAWGGGETETNLGVPPSSPNQRVNV